jgi:hypothetical protein
MFTRTTQLVTACIIAAAALAQANDAYYDIPVSELKLVEGKLPGTTDTTTTWRHYERAQAMQPYAIVDGPGEAYLAGSGAAGQYWMQLTEASALHLYIRAPEGQEVKGRLVFAKADRSGMDVLRFVVPASRAKPEAKVPFYDAKIAHYRNLEARSIPGGAWFRHQARVAAAEMDRQPDAVQPRFTPQVSRQDELTRSYDLLTGGRAISENLQLDRAIPQRVANETPVKVASITGITVKEINWGPLIKNAKPALDPLASKIPFDQHAVFFPSFQAALAVADETKKHDTPVLRVAEPRAEDAGVVKRYERQLGLPMSTLARMLGPTIVKSVAITGGDPSFPLGTDVAVLLESDQPEALAKILTARIALAAAENKDAEPASGDADGVKYRGFESRDRKISSYIAALDGAVVVTNSTYQIKQLAAVHSGKTKSLAELPEYKFFRIRYPRGDAAESALVFISDPTIRRWCGPRWRIADSRRTRARAVLAELQASQLKAIAEHNIEPGPIHTDLPILGGGNVSLTRDGVVSSVYGTLDFMTPIGEMPLDEVTQDEAQGYGFWRGGYQRNWSWGFDPIGLRVSLGQRTIATDLTIMPLILNSVYENVAEVSRGAKFAPTAGDPHKSLVQFVMALNKQSRLFRQGEGFAMMAVSGQPGSKISLGWVGPSLSVYADDDPYWDELAKVEKDKLSDFVLKNLNRLPVALRIDSTNPLGLAAFLAAARTYIEQTAPNLTHWEMLKYNDQGYVRVSPVKGEVAMPPEVDNAAVYYTTVGGALTVSLNDRVLKRAMDRAAAKKQPPAAAAGAKDQPEAKTTKPREWLGSNVGLHVDSRILEVANALGREQYEDRMQVLSWSNLPILNEWKRLFPDRDPVAVHRTVWGVTLVCPGGGKYVWNPKYGTMESTVYGHPGEPKAGPPAPPVLSSFSSADFGLTLENDGLRARVELLRPVK